jgi:hypothetical protein
LLTSKNASVSGLAAPPYPPLDVFQKNRRKNNAISHGPIIAIQTAAHVVKVYIRFYDPKKRCFVL